MAEWSRVKWSQAQQVLAAMGQEAPEGDDVGLPPADYYAVLIAQNRLSEAANFLGQALPRLEAVAWAARVVNRLREEAGLSPRERGSQEALAVKAALLWVQDPSETRRRNAYDAAERCDPRRAERLAALAAFYSGGSITPSNVEALPAPRDAAGRFAAGAVLVASAGKADALKGCLEEGVKIAAHGLAGAQA